MQRVTVIDLFCGTGAFSKGIANSDEGVYDVVSGKYSMLHTLVSRNDENGCFSSALKRG